MIKKLINCAFVVVVIFLDVNALAKNIQCVQPFEAVGSSCYYLSDTIKTWDQANKTCGHLGGWMVTVDSDDENGLLYQWLRSTHHFGWSEWFLGPYIGIYATENNIEVFEWEHPSTTSYRNWVGGIAPVVTSTDRCVTLTEDGEWYNYYCDEELHFICEYIPHTQSPTPLPTSTPTLLPTVIPPTSTKHQKTTQAPTPTPTPACPKGFTWLEESCFALINNAKTWPAANVTCTDHSGWLASLSSEIELERVVNWLTSIGGLGAGDDTQSPFIGLYKSEDSSTFHWESSLDHPSNSFAHWAEGFPSFVSGNENCVHLDSNGYFENTACTDVRSFVCETKAMETASGADMATGDGDNGAHSIALVLFIPLSLFVFGMLFYYFVIREKSPRGSWAPVGSSSKRTSTTAPFSALDDESEGASSHALVGTEMQDLSRFDPLDGSSPEETMEIQLQMRSYAPLKAGQGSFPV